MRKLIKRQAMDSISSFYRGKKSKAGEGSREKFADVDALIDFHFQHFSEPSHPCRETLAMALKMLHQKPAVIVETGSSAWGANSSMLFDAYANSFGGTFESVDIRAEPMLSLSQKCSSKSTFSCDDSVAFLRKFAARTTKVDLVYLDSWDVDWDDPLPSAMHGMYEFLVLLPLLQKGSILLVDDTPNDVAVMEKVQPNCVAGFKKFVAEYGFAPGKGALIKNFLLKNSIGRQIAHDYQLLWEFE